MLMVAETEDAIAEASSQLVAYGYYTPVIVMFDADDARLRDQAEAVRRLVQAEGFGARIETLNATEAYLGSLPGKQLRQYPRAADPYAQPRRSHPAQFGVVGQCGRAMPVLPGRVAASDAGGLRLHSLPAEPACRRCGHMRLSSGPPVQANRRCWR
jgi:hypothetical protein